MTGICPGVGLPAERRAKGVAVGQVDQAVALVIGVGQHAAFRRKGLGDPAERILHEF